MSMCTGSCKYGACNCGAGLYNPSYYSHYSSGMSTEQQLEQILRFVQQMAQELASLSERIQGLEDMMVDVNGGIDEILSERTVNIDEEVCRCSEAGCEGCVTSGDTPDRGEPSSIGQEVS